MTKLYLYYIKHGGFPMIVIAKNETDIINKYNQKPELLGECTEGSEICIINDNSSGYYETATEIELSDKDGKLIKTVN